MGIVELSEPSLNAVDVLDLPLVFEHRRVNAGPFINIRLKAWHNFFKSVIFLPFLRNRCRLPVLKKLASVLRRPIAFVLLVEGFNLSKKALELILLLNWIPVWILDQADPTFPRFL